MDDDPFLAHVRELLPGRLADEIPDPVVLDNLRVVSGRPWPRERGEPFGWFAYAPPPLSPPGVPRRR